MANKEACSDTSGFKAREGSASWWSGDVGSLHVVGEDLWWDDGDVGDVGDACAAARPLRRASSQPSGLVTGSDAEVHR
mgnify:CR=1 FL=1